MVHCCSGMHWTYPRDRAQIALAEAAGKLKGDSSTAGDRFDDIERQKLRAEPSAYEPHINDSLSEPEVSTASAFCDATQGMSSGTQLASQHGSQSTLASIASGAHLLDWGHGIMAVWNWTWRGSHAGLHASWRSHSSDSWQQVA